MYWEEDKDTLVGQLYEGYEVMSVVGSGTFGKVYKVQLDTIRLGTTKLVKYTP